MRPVGYLRFEDPAGEVGMETHLVEDGGVLYQIPMTYRDAPLSTTDTRGRIATAEHSVLGTRYIYDTEVDPLWRAQLVRAFGRLGRPAEIAAAVRFLAGEEAGWITAQNILSTAVRHEQLTISAIAA